MTLIGKITWNGTPDEALSLLHAVRAHCACRVVEGRTVGVCASHTMLACDQRAVDGLVFIRRIAGRLVAEEFEAERATRQEESGELDVAAGRRPIDSRR